MMPSIWRVLGVLVSFVIVPFVLFSLHSPFTAPALAVAAVCVTVYGCYWTMRFVHEDRRKQRERSRHIDF